MKNDDETTIGGIENRVEADVLDESVKRKLDLKVPLPTNESKRVEPEVVE